MKPSTNVVWHGNRQLEKIIGRLTETIDDLQLSITYLLFDLEATKREKEEFRQRLGLPE